MCSKQSLGMLWNVQHEKAGLERQSLRYAFLAHVLTSVLTSVITDVSFISRGAANMYSIIAINLAKLKMQMVI